MVRTWLALQMGEVVLGEARAGVEVRNPGLFMAVSPQRRTVLVTV
jgi:hypothetical protein